MIDKLIENGEESMADYEMVELILFLCLSRKDTKPIAKDLISKFKTVHGVITASTSELCTIEGIAETTARNIKIIEASVNHSRLTGLKSSDKSALDNWAKLIEYCNGKMAHLKTEQFRILFLDAKMRLIKDEVQQKGTISHTSVYPREVAKRAMELDASGIVLVHNHPSGDPTPSRSDITMTKKVAEATESIGVTVHDHVIIGTDGHTSLRGIKLL